MDRLVNTGRVIASREDAINPVVELAWRCSSHSCGRAPAELVVMLDGSETECRHGGPWMACGKHAATLAAGLHNCLMCGEQLRVVSTAGA